MFPSSTTKPYYGHSAPPSLRERLRAEAVHRGLIPPEDTEPVTFTPQPGPQTLFVESEADITIYGGAAGGGKTYGLLIQPIKHIDNEKFGGVIFRRISEQIRSEGGLWDTASEIYPALSARGREHVLDWRFPSGATITFDSIQHEKDIFGFQGAQICYLGFDELTHFTERQFWYLISRNRSMCGVKPYVRATLNPDPDSWVFELVGPWVNEDHPYYPAESGEIRWFVRENGEIKWVPAGTKKAKSITFISANIFDNKILLETNPEYLDNLEAQDETDKQRLLHGLWTAMQAKGALWQREWLDRDRIRPEDLPPIARTVVGVDPSISAGPDSDEAGIVTVSKSKANHFYTRSDVSGVMTPRKWAEVAVAEFYRWNAACIAAEANQGGEMVRTTIHAVDPSVPVVLIHVKVGKSIRAQPAAAASEAGFDHHVGTFKGLEGQLTRWEPDVTTKSPDRLDAKVLAMHELGIPEQFILAVKPSRGALPAHLVRSSNNPGQTVIAQDSSGRIIPPKRTR